MTTLPLIAGRTCGGCTACCEVMEIRTLAKPVYQKCPHQGCGCSIYGMRPEECRSYSCLWLQGVGGPSDRPDKLGVIFDVRVMRSGGKEGLVVIAREVRPGGLEAARDVVDGFASKHPVLAMTREGKRIWGRDNPVEIQEQQECSRT